MSLQATTSQTVGPYLHIGLTWLITENLAPAGVAGERVSIEGRVIDGEVHERAHEGLHRGAGVLRQPQSIEPLEQLAVAVREHRVVERILGFEVRVERRLADADFASQRMEREAADALGACQFPCGGDNRCHPRLSSLRHASYHR